MNKRKREKKTTCNEIEKGNAQIATKKLKET